MKKNWLPRLFVGSLCIWSGAASAQSNLEQSATTWDSKVVTQPNGDELPSSQHLYGYSQPPQGAAPASPNGGNGGQFVGNQPGRYPLPTQLPAPTTPPAGMTSTTQVAGSFTATAPSVQQGFPVSYRQELIGPQTTAPQDAPEIASQTAPLDTQAGIPPAIQSAVPNGPVFSAAPTYVPNPYAGPVAGDTVTGGCDNSCDSTSACADGKAGLGSHFGKFLGGGDANWVVGVNALIFARDYEDDKGLSYNTPGQSLFSTDADLDTFGGIETAVSRRNCSGSGWEARYWGLYPNSASSMIDNMPGTALAGLQNLYFAPAMSNVLQVYNAATTHRVTRENSINNVELNLLRNGGSFTGLRCRNAYYELLGGFRWFQFDESFAYSAINSTAPWPSELNYGVDVQNTLLGFQMGGRTEWCLTDKLRLTTGLRAGMFNNRITHHSRLADQAGNQATILGGPFNGTLYDFQSTKNDLAFLGELDTGLVYQISRRARLNFGYRLIGISGVALAPNQIPYSFTDANDIQRIDSNGSLLLHGAYAGAQFCF